MLGSSFPTASISCAPLKGLVSAASAPRRIISSISSGYPVTTKTFMFFVFSPCLRERRTSLPFIPGIITSRIKAEHFPNPKTLDGFDFSAQPSINKSLVSELMRCGYIDKRENILLMGNPGTGKTHLATALAMEACGRGKKVRFWRVTELITTLMEAREDRQLTGLKGRLAKLDLLVLDELGYVPASKMGAELFFDVISMAYEHTSIMVTTNLPFEQWTEVLGSERLTGAALDHLTHHCHIIETTDESYRLKDAKRRRMKNTVL